MINLKKYTTPNDCILSTLYFRKRVIKYDCLQKMTINYHKSRSRVLVQVTRLIFTHILMASTTLPVGCCMRIL